jgi:hypothetical protein
VISYIFRGEVIMETAIKEKLEEVVALLNDPDETVMDKEIKEKLEKILALLNNPENATVGEKEKEDKLAKVLSLVNNAMVDPDIDIEYCRPDSDDPYLLVTYIVSEYNKPTRKIRLGSTALQSTAEEVANKVTFSIEEFKSEIDSVEMG